jgi:hypothetical protein
MEECTYFWGVNTSWGINTVEIKRPLNQEDNQAPQPTLLEFVKFFNNALAFLISISQTIFLLGNEVAQFC